MKNKKDFKVLIVYPNIPLMLIPSIAIALFTRIYRDQGYKVELFETTYYTSEQDSTSENRMDRLQVREFNITEELQITIKNDLSGDFRRTVEETAPDLLVFSVVEDAFFQTVKLLKAVEDLNVPHLVGGIFPTNAPQRCFDFPEIKMIGLGEGEETVLAVSEAVRLCKSLDDIPGTWIRNEDGSVKKNAQPPLVDISNALPDFSLFDDKRFMRPMGGRLFKMMPVETYRGCPYACTYCNATAQRTFTKNAGLGNFLRRKKMGVLRDELAENVARFNPGFFFFIDDSFLARPRREIYEFCDMYEEFKLPFWFNTRAENCTPEILQRLKEVGCYRMSASVECGNEEFRFKVLQRKIKNTDLIDRFKIVADSGIAFSIDVMIGMPGETREMIMDTVELIRSIPGYDSLTVSIFVPYHGTVLHRVAANNGWLAADSISSQAHSRSQLKMPPPYLNAEEIQGLTTMFPLYCYFPKSEWEHLRRAETPDEEGRKIHGRYMEIYRTEFLGETQDDKKALWVEGAAGCRSNPKDAFRVSPKRLSEEEIELLTQTAP